MCSQFDKVGKWWEKKKKRVKPDSCSPEVSIVRKGAGEEKQESKEKETKPKSGWKYLFK